MSHPPFLHAPHLSSGDRVAHGFFGREGGVSGGLYASLNVGPGSEDDPSAVAENRARVAGAIGAADADHLLSLYQIHSADALVVDAPFPAGERPQSDAMATATPGLALCVLAADCAPVLFCDEAAGVVGAAHAGWKGALGGVCEAAVEAMERLGADRGRIAAAVGPCIAQASYEVGPEFEARFLEAEAWSARFFVEGRGDRRHFNLPAYVQAKLVRVGVGRTEILPEDTCALEERYFSNRRRNQRGEADYGRNASVVMLRA
ncbi:MAG: peptidoglycan editing factor PgeF [Pseudomonadota bacterium]